MTPSENFCTGCGARFVVGERFCRSCGKQRHQTHTSRKTRAVSSIPANSNQTMTELLNPLGNPIFFFAIAQVMAIVLYHIAQIADNGIRIDLAFKFGLPSTVLMLGFASPVLFVGFVGRYSREVSALAAVVITGLVQFARNAQLIFESGDFYYENHFLWVLHHLFGASAIAASVFAVVEILRDRKFESLISPTADWWRIPIGVIAGVVLMFEYPGRVLEDRWRALSLLVVLLLVAGTIASRATRIGLFAGLGAGIVGSIFANAMYWLFNSEWRHWRSFLSLPSLIALVCCAVILSVDMVDPPSNQSQLKSPQK